MPFDAAAVIIDSVNDDATKSLPPKDVTHSFGRNVHDETTPQSSESAAVSADKSVLVPGYLIYEVVGRGGMGIVYRARDLAFDRDVVVKLLQD